MVFNIPADVYELKSDAGNVTKQLLPEETVQSNTDMGTLGYVGAAPPTGPAPRYLITVYALKQKNGIRTNYYSGICRLQYAFFGLV